MRGLLLFAKTRRWLLVLAVSVLTAALVLACGPLSYALNPRNGMQITVAAQVPLIAAIAIQASLTSGVAHRERQAARSLVPWRFLHIVVTTSVAALAVGIAAAMLDPRSSANLHGANSIGPVGLVRNLFAFTGVSLIGAVLVGPAFAWIFPLAWSILPFAALRSSQSDPSGILTLARQPDSAFVPMAVALSVWLLGLLLAINRRS